MNRAEFMRRLTELLGDVPPMEREEAIQYYNDYFDDAGEENESSVIASLGTPEELAGSIRAGLSDAGNGGEFTESGFRGYTQAPKDEIMRTEDAASEKHQEQSGTRTDDASYSDTARYNGSEYSGSQGTQNGNSYYDGAYYRRPEGDGIYGGRADTRSHSNPYEQNGSQNNTYGQSGSWHSGYGQNGSTSQSTAYGQSGGSQSTAYGQTGAQYTAYGQTGGQKDRMSGGMIVLIVILAILTSPVWIGLLGAFFGLAAGVIATLFALFLSFLVIGVAFVAVSIALLVTGISLMFSVPAGGLCVLGCAFAFFGVGLLFVWLMVLMAGTAIPAFIRGVVSLCQRVFHRGGARA